jgi:uncharacterized protein (TIGR02284 family)
MQHVSGAEKPTQNIELLNSLIETTIDSVDGYEKAAEAAKGDEVSVMFRRFADERREAVARLRDQVRKLGGTPEDDGSVLASAHRTFLELRTYVQSDRKAAIMEVERGEDFIKSRYEDALDEPDLAPDVRDTITSCYDTVLRGHDSVASLKRALES